MGDAGGELADRLQLLHLLELLLGLFLRGNVDDHRPGPHEATLAVALAARRQPPLEDLAGALDEAIFEGAHRLVARQHVRPCLLAIELRRFRGHELRRRAAEHVLARAAEELQPMVVDIDQSSLRVDRVQCHRRAIIEIAVALLARLQHLLGARTLAYMLDQREVRLTELGGALGDTGLERLRHAPQLCLGLALHGDVGMGAKPAGDAARRIAQRRCLRQKRSEDAVGAAQRKDHLEGLPAVERCAPAGEDSGQLGGIMHGLPAPAHRLLRRRPGVFVPAPVEPEDPAVRPRHPG